MPSGPNNATRTINLIYFLDAHKRGATSRDVRNNVSGYNPDQSDEAFERQFRRDREELKSLGLPVYQKMGPDDEVLYYLDPKATKQEPIDLDLKDVSLLTICAKNALENPAFLMKDELVAAMDNLALSVKIDRSVLTPLSSDGRPLDDAGTQDGLPRSVTEKQLLDAISDAHENGKSLSFDYENASGASSSRKVLPIRLFSYLGDLYMLAYDLEKDDSRRFKLDRMISIPKLENASSKDLLAAKMHFNDPASILPFQYGKSRLDGRIYLSGKIEHRIPSLTMSKGSLDRFGKGFLWSIEVADAGLLAQWAVENGPGILIIEPARVADMVESGLRKLAGNSEGGTASSADSSVQTSDGGDE